MAKKNKERREEQKEKIGAKQFKNEGDMTPLTSSSHAKAFLWCIPVSPPPFPHSPSHYLQCLLYSQTQITPRPTVGMYLYYGRHLENIIKLEVPYIILSTFKTLFVLFHFFTHWAVLRAPYPNYLSYLNRWEWHTFCDTCNTCRGVLEEGGCVDCRLVMFVCTYPILICYL